jgi:hypothetical protein
MLYSNKEPRQCLVKFPDMWYEAAYHIQGWPDRVAN